jgi:IS5 family transposase
MSRGCDYQQKECRKYGFLARWAHLAFLRCGYTKVRYREIRKNANQVFTLCALSNLFLLCQRLLYTQKA